MIALLLACAADAPVTVSGPHGAVTVNLVNPTSCSFCDPFAGIDTLRVDVLVGSEVVASESFSYPGSDVALPALDGFGVVRIAMYGLSFGVVTSAGRTAEIALDPGMALSVPMVFLPADTLIPVPSPMIAARSRHLSVRARDGRVHLFGGANPDREGTFSSVEVFDPATFAFSQAEGSLPSSVAAARADWVESDQLLIVGGFQSSGSTEIAVSRATEWSQTDGSVVEQGSLASPRNGHCFAVFRERMGVVMGGAEGGVELVKPDATTQAWAFSELPQGDFDATRVSGCVAVPGEQVFAVGSDAASTGLWRFDDATRRGGLDDVELLGEGADRFVSHPALVPTGSDVWVLGGGTSAEALDDTRWYRAARHGFEPGLPLASPRFEPVWDRWIDDRVVVGCGWADVNRSSGQAGIELVDPADLVPVRVMALDRDRDGCALSTLLDGSILVTGGYSATDEAAVDAAILVPGA